LKPDYAEAHSNLGGTLQELGRLDEAEASYKQAIALKPDFAEAHNNLGITLQELGRLDEAEASYKQAIALKPDFAEAHYNLGNTLHKLGRLEEAEASYRQAIELTTGFSKAHQKLAITQRELGKIEQAIQSERYVRFLNSSNVGANESENFPDNLPFKQPSPVEYPALYRPGMGTENVGGFLRAMAQMLRPKNILEIGAGYTTPFLLEALINNERVYDDGNLEPSYFKDYVYDSKLVVIDNMSLGELSKKPGMDQIISSKYIEFVEGNFEGKADILGERYGDFDFVWFDCGGSAEYKIFMDEYWDICSDYIFFHFTYTRGSPNELHDIILNNVTGNPSIFDIVEPHKSRQGSITMVRKK
jgi:tetratricopeptide (TPR) repeat protein